MNIRRFVARDMRQALRDVRASLGPDAVMLSSRTLDDGVEVIAAIDYDDSLLAAVEDQQAAARRAPTGVEAPATDRGRQAAEPASEPRLAAADTYAAVAAAVQAQAARGPAPASAAPPRQPAVAAPRPSPPSRQRRPAVAVAPAPAQPRPQTTQAQAQRRPTPARRAPGQGQRATVQPRRPPLQAGRPAAKPVAEPAAKRPAPPQMALAGPVAAELNDLRQLLEHQLASLAWNDMNRRRPAVARSLRQLARLGIDPDIARGLVADCALSGNERDAWRLPLRLLGERLPLAKRDLVDLPGIFALIGPTGVGKTTTIAKLAARFVMRYGVNKLGLISTDSYRIGAREQLMTFARILGTPMQVASSAEEMRAVLDGMRHKRLVLIDTAGMSQRDLRLAEQFETLRVRGYKIRSILALSAASDRDNLREALRVFLAARPRAFIATKLDEAASLGPILSLALASRLPLAYIADGQRVPEDLHLAGRRRAWLVQQALRLAGEHAAPADEDALASRYAGLELVANG